MATLKTKILQRNDLRANWESNNPILGKGEMGLEIDTGLFKFGDGEKNWNDLKYANDVLVPANASIEIVDGKITVSGFEGADVDTLPQKQSDGTVKWVPISSIVEGDGNTVSIIAPADGSVNVELTTAEETDTRTYSVKVNVSEEEGNRVEVKEDGIYVADPEAYDDTALRESVASINESINTLAEDIAAVEADLTTEAGRIDSAVERLDGHDAKIAEIEEQLQSNDAKFQELEQLTQIVESLPEELKQYTDDQLTIEKERAVAAEQANADAIAAEKARLDAFLKLEDGETLNAALDTLKELQDYITNEANEADQLVLSIAAAQEAADAAQNDVDALELEVITRLEALEAIDHEHANKDVLDAITADKVAEWDNAQADAEATAAQQLDSAKQELQGLINSVDAKVGEVAAALPGKVDKITSEYNGEQVAWTLLSPENQAKLAALVIGDNGIEVSGKVNASNVEELDSWITTRRDSIGGLLSVEKEAKLDAIESNAQVNKLESISINGVPVETSVDKNANIPLASTENAGVVVGSSTDNGVSVSADGTMSVNNITTDKLIQGEDLLILDGGDAQA